jgi:hypothetical protein
MKISTGLSRSWRANLNPGLPVTRFIVIILFVSLVSQAFPQSGTVKTGIPDSIMEKKHSPTKATIFSAVLPGLGQIYNKKYWKVPVVYAGFGVLTYFIVQNANSYMEYHCAYIEKVNNAKHGNYQDLTDKYTKENLLSASEYYRRNLEISILLSAVWYIMNILDATVDAHLFTYNISKDIAFQAGPTVMTTPSSRINPGIKLSFTIK